MAVDWERIPVGRRNNNWLPSLPEKAEGFTMCSYPEGHHGLRRFPHPSSLRRMQKIRLTSQGSGALHLAILEKPLKVVIPACDL